MYTLAQLAQLFSPSPWSFLLDLLSPTQVVREAENPLDGSMVPGQQNLSTSVAIIPVNGNDRIKQGLIDVAQS